jgi:hypothetical protein
MESCEVREHEVPPIRVPISDGLIEVEDVTVVIGWQDPERFEDVPPIVLELLSTVREDEDRALTVRSHT